MAQEDRGPTLTDSVGLGGVIAQDGFDYQLWQGIVRLPAWLANPTFEALIFEGLEDIEARFFAPQSPAQRLLERFQAKSGSLSPQETREVFERFHTFERTHPLLTRVHTLITPQLPPTLRWIGRDAARVRLARPFYAPFAALRAASDSKFRDDLVQELGEPLGSFVADGVEAVEHPLPSRDFACHAFSAAFAKSFPAVDPATRTLNAVFEALVALARRSTGRPLTRQLLTETVESAAAVSLATGSAFPIHVRSDRNEAREDALEIDASAFSGDCGVFPESSRWAELIVPLEATASWLKQQQVSRVRLSGSYRLSSAFLLGRSFRSAHGFEIEIPTRDEVWPTDDRPEADGQSAWSIGEPQALPDGRLVVSVGVLRRPREDLTATGADSTSILDCFLDHPLRSAKEAQAGVALVKKAVATAISRLGPTSIDLYIAAPASFTVALGHRWNAMPATQLHEFDAGRRAYVRTALTWR